MTDTPVKEVANKLLDWSKGFSFLEKMFFVLLLMYGANTLYDKIWTDPLKLQATKEAHTMVRTVLKERDEAEKERAIREDERTDKVLAMLSGIKQEQKKTTTEVAKIPVAAKAAAEKILEEKAE